ncbi:MAG: Gfo/Idh/MocA family protein [Saprospiraceae bacterium]
MSNRRSFLKNTLLAGTSLALFPHCSSSTSPTQKIIATGNKKDKLGVALVGLGGYSRGQLAPALQLTEHCYLAGIVTGSPDKIPRWQAQYGIKDANVYSYDNIEQIANNDEIDIIYIVLPTALHAQYAIKAANTGKHVWLEKPMAMNVAECQAVIDACNKNKVKLSIGYRMQHEPNTKTLIGYADSQPYGNMQSVKALAGYRGNGGGGWRAKKAMGGGALYDMGVYTINGIRYATQMEPIRVNYGKVIINRPDLFPEVDETTEYELEFANGLTAYGRTSVGESINQLRVDCERGWYELAPMQSYNGVEGKTSDGKALNIFIENQQARQMDDDALAIKNNTSVMVPGIEGLNDIRIVNAIQRAAHLGKSVAL